MSWAAQIKIEEHRGQHEPEMGPAARAPTMVPAVYIEKIRDTLRPVVPELNSGEDEGQSRRSKGR